MISDTDNLQHPGVRTRSRVDVNFGVTVQCSNRESALRTQDISLKGVLCVPNPGFSEGGVCDIIIELDSDAKISVSGIVARSNEASVAFDFIKMDEESFRHLYNLIRLNSENAEDIESELQYPAFEIHSGIYERNRKK